MKNGNANNGNEAHILNKSIDDTLDGNTTARYVH